MPIYEWLCQDCEHVTTRFSSTFEPEPVDCEECGGTTKKKIGVPHFRFIGAGFYCNDKNVPTKEQFLGEDGDE
jgi:putative FmdB family regulatory protein